MTWGRVKRALRKPPAHIARRILTEVRHELDRFIVPGRGRSFDADALLRAVGGDSIGQLWDRLAETPRPFPVMRMDATVYEEICPGDAARILAAAERGCRHEIDLLGSGPVLLGERIDWHTDYKSGYSWPLGYFRDVDYINRGRPSDVKSVWEMSRMQWLIPAGQAYLLTGDGRYAAAVRDVLTQWMASNPYGRSVNWGVTMEPAMRIFTWIWFFHVFCESQAWADQGFRGAFLSSLYLHAEFTERFFERGDINGNHFSADAAALIAAGAFFRTGRAAERWLTSAQTDLEREVLRQVFPDGVDFEASTAYHRLVAEFFLHASLWAQCAGRPFSASYRTRLRGMGTFIAAYTRSDGSTPLWGDADDARTLPFGGQHINDHRYLPGLIALHLNDQELLSASGGPRAEAVWLYGIDAAGRLPHNPANGGSCAFADSGFFVMRTELDHVFVDCGPIGLADRGGHGHNDALSFEAMLDGELLVCDSGCFVYTADFDARNKFRATAAHNTPRIDGEEINRFGSADLWTLLPDSAPEARSWQTSTERDELTGRHKGYCRLPEGVIVERHIALDRLRHALSVIDRFDGAGNHTIEIPLHLAPGVRAQRDQKGGLVLASGGKRFSLTWSDARWALRIEDANRAWSYGVLQGITRLTWSHSGPLAPFSIEIAPLHPSGYRS